MTKGKYFEHYLSKKLKEIENVEVIRLRDTPTVNGRNTKNTQNPCDFIVFEPNNAMFIECKACKTSRLPISRIKQIERLQKFNFDYTKTYIAINFYEFKTKGLISVKDILNMKERSIKYDNDKIISLKEFLKALRSQ